MRVEKKDKKVEEAKDQEIIEINDDVRVGDFILEKGDKIVILEADKKDDKDKDDDDDDKKKDKDKKKKESTDDELKEAILVKIAAGETLTLKEKKFVISL